MRSTHPAVKEARNALKKELEALTKRISAGRKPKRQYNASGTDRDQAKGGDILSASERAGESAREKRSHKRHRPAERSLHNEPTTDSPKNEGHDARAYSREKIVGKAARILRWFKGLFSG